MTRLFERIRPPEDFPAGMSKEQLMDQISVMGLPSGAAVLVQSSLKALGEIRGGALTVADALCESLDRGTLFMPVFTYMTVDGGHNVFDPDTEPSCTGILGEVLLRHMPGTVRTGHPEYSLAVWGEGAAGYALRETCFSSPCPRTGCIGALTDNGGYILLAGTRLESCLHIFAAGEWLEPEKWLSPPEIRYTVDSGGRVIMCSVSRYAPEAVGSAKYFRKLLPPLKELGAVKTVRFGNADCLLCSCAKLVSVASNLLFRCPGLFSDSKPVPRKILKAVKFDEETLARRRLSDD